MIDGNTLICRPCGEACGLEVGVPYKGFLDGWMVNPQSSIGTECYICGRHIPNKDTAAPLKDCPKEYQFTRASYLVEVD